jgi:hypothetical protein
MSSWRNRIIGEEMVAPDELLANPMNWRIHPWIQQESLAAVLDSVGWVKHVIVNNRTGHVIDGHLRVMLALDNPQEKIPVLYVDLDDEEERLILATLDPIAAMAITDRTQLASLIESVDTGQHVTALIAKQQNIADTADRVDNGGQQLVMCTCEKCGHAHYVLRDVEGE